MLAAMPADAQQDDDNAGTETAVEQMADAGINLIESLRLATSYSHCRAAIRLADNDFDCIRKRRVRKPARKQALRIVVCLFFAYVFVIVPESTEA